MRPLAPLVFHPAYDAHEVGDDHRFPMRKFAAVADLAVAEGLAGQNGLRAPAPAPENWLTLVHSHDYVARVIEQRLPPETVRRIGFPMHQSIIERARLAVGGTCLAARLALEGGVAFNLAGGSHHADAEGGAGYCVFNDVAVAARLLIAEGAIRRVLVIDLDVHQGDGTARIFASDPSVFTFSLHCEANWPSIKARSDLDVGLPAGTGDEAYLAALDAALAQVIDSFCPEIAFYNAGVDPHQDDRLGRLRLTDQGLLRRDQLVAGACQERGVPLVGVLGGGYQHDINRLARLHLASIRAVAKLAIA